jgi:transposase-like protein
MMVGMDRSGATGVTAVRDRRALPASERTIQRRRRFRLEEKQAILRAASEPGARVSEVSRQQGATDAALGGSIMLQESRVTT